MPELLSRLQSALSDRYRLDREIGAGGMATVYLAADVRHDRRVALKVLRPELAAVIGAERFLAEIKLTANLQHPHILPLFDSGEADGFLFYVMPFVEGETLRDRLNREKQLPVADAVRIATEVARALDYAHRHGVVHRDIKPENILLHDGQALVADFGIALAVSKAGGARMTETGMRLGTPHYMSPEQAMGEREIDARADVYALGAVMYEMLTGDPPFTGSTAQAVVARVVTESPRPLVSAAPHRPAAGRGGGADRAGEAPGRPVRQRGGVRRGVEGQELPVDGGDGAGGGGDGRADAGAHGRVVYALGGALFAGDRDGALGLAPARTAPVVNRCSLFLRSSEALQPSVNGSINVAHHRGREARGVRRTGRGWRADLAAAITTAAARPIGGTEGGTSPFFSPDGRSIGFLVGGRTVKVVSLGGGPAITLSDSINSSGGDWGSDGYVYIEVDSGLARIRATGGPQEPVYRIGQGRRRSGPSCRMCSPAARAWSSA